MALGEALVAYLAANGVTVEAGRATSGATSLEQVNAGKSAYALATSLEAAGAIAGRDGVAPLGNLRVAARLGQVRYTYLARRDLGVSNLAGLRGRRVAYTLAGDQAMTDVNDALLKTVLLKRKDVRASQILSFNDGVRQLIAGELDAVPVALDSPLVARAERAVPGGVGFVTMFGPNATSAFVGQKIPGAYVVEVQANPNATPIKVAAFDILLVTHADADQTAVGAVVRALWNRRAEFETQHPALRTLIATDDMRIATEVAGLPPYHPGALAALKAPSDPASADQSIERRGRTF